MAQKRLQQGFRLGDLSASALNAACDAGARQRQFGPLPGPPSPGNEPPHPYIGVPCNNTIEAELKERSIVGIKETAYTLPADADLADEGVLVGESVDVELPDVDKHTAGRWGVVLGPIAAAGSDGGGGFLVTAGLVKVRIDRLSLAHEFAAIVHGQTDYLVSAEDGVPVTWFASGATGLQWCQINLWGSDTIGSAPPLRWFELTARKTLAETTATVKWLDNDGNMIGDDVTIHDPQMLFAGRIAGYLFAEDPENDRGFRGQAIERRDLAEEEPDFDRWDIVTMEGYATWIRGVIVVPDTGGGDPHALFDAGDYVNRQETWNSRWPALPLGQVLLNVTDALYRTHDGDEVRLMLVDPDTTPPTYEVMQADGYRLIRGTVWNGPITDADEYFFIDNVAAMSWGYDPSNGSATAQIQVFNVNDESWEDNDKVEAAWSRDNERWEALLKSGGGTTQLQWGEVTVTIDPMTGWGTWGEGEVQFKDDAGADDGSPIEVENRYPDEFPVQTSVCCDRKFTPPRVVAGSCSPVPSE